MSFAGQLRDQFERLGQLLSLLGHERMLLSQGSIDGMALGQLATEKQEVLTTLEDLEQQRKAARTQLGYSSDWAGDELAAHASGCLGLWQELRTRTREAARLNRFNGELIAMRMTSNQRILNDLRSLIGADIYGPDGQARGYDSRLTSQA